MKFMFADVAMSELYWRSNTSIEWENQCKVVNLCSVQMVTEVEVENRIFFRENDSQ